MTWIEPGDVSDAVLLRCSEAAKYITGVAADEAGTTVKT